MTQEDLQRIFQPFGRIITSRILVDPSTGNLSNFNIYLIFYFQRRSLVTYLPTVSMAV